MQADVAQLVEQLIRNQQVVSSSLTVGSRIRMKAWPLDCERSFLLRLLRLSLHVDGDAGRDKILRRNHRLLPFGVGGSLTPGLSSMATNLCCPHWIMGMVKLAWKLPSGPTGAAPAFVPCTPSTQIHTEPPGANFEPRKTTGSPTLDNRARRIDSVVGGVEHADRRPAAADLADRDGGGCRLAAGSAGMQQVRARRGRGRNEDVGEELPAGRAYGVVSDDLAGVRCRARSRRRCCRWPR